MSITHCHFFFLPVFVSQLEKFTLALITTNLWLAGIVNIFYLLHKYTFPPFFYINCTNLYWHPSYKNLLTRLQLCPQDHDHHHLAAFFSSSFCLFLILLALCAGTLIQISFDSSCFILLTNTSSDILLWH